ncbi:DUF4321 domain-containing protein [candidate division TA06 bacterium]|uniref:DUF4321 domain-containing protein n=1 Tax=candidate division TA06 bacterium TaxID=2250710 RepID=A0A933I8V2_UNCT6|nr:DUF4321 domain-containing protein [candidate division TA06 bacterium]
MALKKRGAGFYLVIILAGALLGSGLGDLAGYILPSGVVRDFFTKAITPGINPPLTINLLVVSLTLGFTLKLNIIALLGIVLMAYLLKWF